MIKQFAKVSFGALGGAFAYYCYENNLKSGNVRASRITGYSTDYLHPASTHDKWNSNWDMYE